MPDVKEVEEAKNGNGAEVLTLIEERRLDVAVPDCKLPGLAGPQVAQEIRRRGLPVRVLALSSYDDDRYVRGMLEAGAVGYLLKEEAPETIVAAVRGAMREEGYFSPPVAKKMTAWARGELPGGLTKREMEVLRLVAKGKTDHQIGEILCISTTIVRSHIQSILNKLKCANRTEVAVRAMMKGILSPAEIDE